MGGEASSESSAKIREYLVEIKKDRYMVFLSVLFASDFQSDTPHKQTPLKNQLYTGKIVFFKGIVYLNMTILSSFTCYFKLAYPYSGETNLSHNSLIIFPFMGLLTFVT